MKSQEEFDKEVLKAGKGEYQFTEPYKGNKKKIKVLHKVCGKTFDVVPVKFLHDGQRCPYCSGRRITQDILEKRIDAIFGKGKYTVLSKYISTKEKINIKCNTCGKSRWANAASILRGNKCPYCSRKEKAEKVIEGYRKTYEDRLKKLHGSEYTIVSPYKGANNYIKVRHNPCGREYWVNAMSLLEGAECKECIYKRYSKAYVKTTDQYAKEVNRVSNGEYELVGKYVDTKTYVKIRHKSCGTVYKVYPYLFQRGRRCPVCNTVSHGEMFISKILNDCDIKYELHKSFKDCKDDKMLSYDFYLPKYNSLIEYQGKQHYLPVPLFGGKPQFKKQQLHDKIKRTYAAKNGYHLIEIPYTCESLETIKSYLLSNLSKL